MGSLAQLKRKMEEQKVPKDAHQDEPAKFIGQPKKRTPVQLKASEGIILPPDVVEPLRSDSEALSKLILPKFSRSQKQSLLLGGESALVEPLPQGYSAIGKNDVAKLMELKRKILEVKICAFDYETDGDPDDDTQDPQDHKLVGVSFAYEIGQAFYMPIAHDFYAANWEITWFVDNFLKPVLEDPDVLVIAHNVMFEHQISLLYGIDMFPKACLGKVMDTMIMVKALALPENTEYLNEKEGYAVIVGLKPVTKALLADENGMVNGLIHVDDIKSFKETVGTFSWEEPIPGEFYKSGAKKGLPKTSKVSRHRTFNELPVDKEVIDYGCSDSDWALTVHKKLLPLCHSEGVYDVIVELDVPRMMVLGEYSLAGWQINPDRLRELGVMADKALGEIAPALYAGLLEVTEGYADTDEESNVIVPAGVYSMGDWRGDPVSLEIKKSKPFSWGSVQHLQWLFFHVLKVSTTGLERSKITGLPSTGAENIDKILERNASHDGNKFIDVLQEKRKYDKIKSTYVDGMLPFSREDTAKLHTSLKLVSTWRLSSSKPNLQNCFDKETRILTPLGWKYFYELKKGVDTVAQYTPETGLVSFTKPTAYIAHYEEELVSIKNQHVDLKVTKDHRCLLRNRKSRNWKVYAAKNYHDDMHQYHAGEYKFGNISLSEEEIDLICMTQADGYYHDGGIDFGFSKGRKVVRFLAIMKSLDISYSEHKERKDGQRRFRILKGLWVDFVQGYLGSSKSFGSWVINLDRRTVLTLLNYVYFWDGCFTRDNHYSSNNRSNVEWIQILHVLTGTRANVRIYQGTKNLNYQIDKTAQSYSGTANIVKEIVPYNDEVYCVTVPSSYLVVERNGKVMITGNCPRAENDPMGIRGVFEAPTYDLTKDYSAQNILTRPSMYINLNKLSGITVWVGADYAQIELKVLAWYAGEQSMINTLASGGDMHSSTALEVFKLNCLVEEVKTLFKPFRYRAKKVNFGLVYGMTEYGLSKDPKMGMTVDQAKAFIEQYMITYPGVRAYERAMIAFARIHGYVETMFGHRRPIPEINSPNKWIRKKGENKAMNTPIQGSAADIIAEAMVALRKETTNPANKIAKYLKAVIQVHDELMCETPVEYASEAAWELKSIMERPIEGFSEIMPIIAEPSVGKIWRHALDIKWDEHGVPYVKPKKERKELSDVTYEDIEYALPLYKMANIRVV